MGMEGGEVQERRRWIMVFWGWRLAGSKRGDGAMIEWILSIRLI